ncbi:CotH kinase family protein [Paenibacillus montanisoli]|nr:CotH kinase family protein [Paenibacillus montanisoli]
MSNKKIGISLLLVLVAIAMLGWRLMERQSSNEGKSHQDVSYNAEPRFSLQPGWYPEGTKLAIALSGDERMKGKLVYTLDGAEPTAAATAYDKPIVLDRTVLVRAKLFYEDGTAGPETAGFFGIGAKPALPVAVVLANLDRLSEETIPARFQWFDPEGALAYESGAGMELFGGESRLQPQQSLELKAKKKYGGKSFAYRFFDQRERKAYNSIILRNGGQDFPLTHMRDSLSSLIAEPILEDVQAYRPVAVYLNNRYWGIYDLREKLDEQLLADRHGLETKSIDLLESDGEAKAGGDKAFKLLLEELRDARSSSPPDIRKLESMIDTDNLFDYMIVEAYIGNTDWPDHNIRYWRSDQHDGKWRWLLYDADLGFGKADEPTLNRLLSPALASHPSVELFQTLLQDAGMRERFLKRFGTLLNGPLSTETVTAAIDRARAALEPEMERHQERWGGTVSGWHAETDKLVSFAAKRPAELTKQVRQQFRLSDAEMNAYGLK